MSRRFQLFDALKMQTHRIKSGLKAGMGGFIATLLFLIFSVYVFRLEFELSDFQSAPKRWFMLAWIVMATLPTLAEIPAVIKTIYVEKTEKRTKILEKGILGTRCYTIEKDASVEVELRIFASPNTESFVQITGDIDAKIGKGLRSAELKALHSAITD